MKLENRMSLGYVKGKYWVPDTRFDEYLARDSFKALMRACRQGGFTFDCSFSYTAQTYHCEILTIERFEKSSQQYIIRHNNAYDPHPMAAVSEAIRHYDRVTPFALLCCLEIECELLVEAYRAAVAREKWQAANEAKLAKALDDLRAVLDMIPVPLVQGDTVISTATVGELRSRPSYAMPHSRTLYDEDDDL